MPLKAGIGRSNLPDAGAAAAEAYDLALRGLGDKADILLLFASASYNYPKLVSAINEISDKTKLVGCSTAGEIAREGVFSDSVLIAAIRSDDVGFFIGLGKHTPEDHRACGRNLAKSIMDQCQEPDAVLAFSDGLIGNGTGVAKGVQEIFGEGALLAGASAGDGLKCKATWQFFGDKILSGHTVGVGIMGNIRMGVGVSHGWMPVGLARTVTRTEANIIYELDNQPAFKIYEDYMGADTAAKLKTGPIIASKEGATRPLGINAGRNRYLIRQPFFVQAEDGALICSAETAVRSEVFLMLGDAESIIESAQDAARQALEQLGGGRPSLALIFSDCSRHQLLKEKHYLEIEAIKEIIGTNIPIGGFVSYGEFAPFWIDNYSTPSLFHNESVIVFLLA